MSTLSSMHVVFGTGPLGQAVMRALLARGQAVRMVNRSGKAAGLPAGVALVAADAYDPAQAARVTADAAVVYQCAQPAYSEWPQKFPPLQRSIVEGVARSGAKLIIGDNLYMYGPVAGPIHEDLPYVADGHKGRTRALMAREALQAHAAGKVRVALGRGSDFYGPQVLGSAVGERVFIPLLQGKAVQVLGDPDALHTWTYIDDFGEALVRLGERDEALGRAWHVPNAPTITTRAFLTQAAQIAGQPLRLQVMGKWMLRLGGLFIPTAREMIEMLYEFEKPYVVDHSQYAALFGDHSTPSETGLRQTLAWYQAHLAEGVR